MRAIPCPETFPHRTAAASPAARGSFLRSAEPSTTGTRATGTRAAALRTALLLALLLAGVLAAPTTPAQEAPAAAGRWQGAIELPGTSLEVTVDLEQGADGAWSGDVDIPAQGASDLPLTVIAVDGDAVTFRIANVPGEPTFRGTLSAGPDGPVLEGEFEQGGSTFPFSLQRVGEAAVAERIGAEQALAGFDAWMAEQLDAFQVPGAAIAVVRDGQVVLAEGYGLRDVEEGLPVTGDTLFAIGSATKAFTTTVLATLVDEGKLDWDEPVRDFLPSFKLFDEVATTRVTPRDLVSHRTGLPRHDLVWYGSPLDREELFLRLQHLEPTEDLRARWQYQNLMYMTAGHLAGRIAGSDWETLVAERIFDPLGMERSTLSIADMVALPDHARGYEEEDTDDDGTDEVVPMPYRELVAVGPAGSINSSARDMARWLQLNLGGGEVDDRRVVSAAALGELHQPLMVVQGGLFSALFQQPEMPYLMYGMGWFVQPYRGHEMVHHGGNIDGFSARVTFLPKEGLGVVVLTNKNVTNLPTVATLHLLDRFLGIEPTDWSARYRAIEEQVESVQEAGEERADVDRKEGTSPSHPLETYAGTYRHPAYGDVVVTMRDDALHLEYHTLESTLEHWHYDVFRATEEDLEGTRLTFRNDLGGNLDKLAVALQPGVDPIEFDLQPPPALADPARLAAYAGDYELMGATVTVRVREEQVDGQSRGRLVVTLPGQPPATLIPVRPDEFEVEGEEGIGATFLRNEAGEVTELIFLQPQGNVPAKRKPTEEAEHRDAA